MGISEQTLWIIAVVLFFGLVLPNLFRRIQLPFTTSLIIIGAILGPNTLNLVGSDTTLEIFGFLGATFHMLLAGFETETLQIRKAGNKFWLLETMSIVVPFITGTFITRFFGYDWPTSLFMGTVFVSSSLLIVFSAVRNLKIGSSKIGRTLKSMVVIEDLFSSIGIFILFKYISPHERFPLLILLGLLISSVIILRMFLPEVIGYFFTRFARSKEGHEAQLRLIIVLLFFVLIFYSSLDVHPIIGAFLVGFILSETPKSSQIKEKLNTIGYALFIPIYLFVTGTKMDVSILLELDPQNLLPIVIIVGALMSKWVSGFIGARLVGFPTHESLVIAISSSSKLTITISATWVALSFGLIDQELYTAVLTVSVITTVLNPTIMSALIKKPAKG